MEEAVSFLTRIKDRFECKEVDIRTYSPLTLAFIGDGVYDLVIRTVIVERGNRAPSGLHKAKSLIVKAQAQAELAEAIADELTDDEAAVYRRGRNAKSYTTAKNASVADYRKATGLEALIGYLYLQNKEERILELIQSGVMKLGIEL